MMRIFGGLVLVGLGLGRLVLLFDLGAVLLLDLGAVLVLDLGPVVVGPHAVGRLARSSGPVLIGLRMLGRGGRAVGVTGGAGDVGRRGGRLFLLGFGRVLGLGLVLLLGGLVLVLGCFVLVLVFVLDLGLGVLGLDVRLGVVALDLSRQGRPLTTAAQCHRAGDGDTDGQGRRGDEDEGLLGERHWGDLLSIFGGKLICLLIEAGPV